MKTATLTSPTIASNNMQSSVMGMSMRGMDMASYFLRDRIYSDKVLAVVREYICNAYDEHTKYKVTDPVLVKLYQEDSKWFWSVRDKAKGLNEHDIRNVFGMYFESTKSNSNDSIGGFGIGSKSFMSYTDSFYITSHHKGICTRYVATLGAGSNGIPVGEIYKISEELTTESGIEIKAEIISQAEFSSTTKNFVNSFSPDANIVFENYKYFSSECDVITPIQPLSSLKIKDYIIHQYSTDIDSYSYSPKIMIRMGGVVYSKRANFTSNFRLINNIVIDIPIGKMSIPISRESFEDTPANQKVLLELLNILEDVEKQEKESLTNDVPLLSEYLKNPNNAKFSKFLEGKYFSFPFDEIFPDNRKFVSSIDRTTWENIPHNSNNKLEIYLLPDIKSVKSWHKRLTGYLSQSTGYIGHFTMPNSLYTANLIKNSVNIDISDIEFIDVKSLSLPKLETIKSDKRFLVYNYSKLGSFNAEELEEYVSSRTKIELTDNWWVNVETRGELCSRSIRLSEDGSRMSGYSTRSKVLFQEMLDMGWLNLGSKDYQNKIDNIIAEEVEKNKFVQAKNNFKKEFFGMEPTEKLLNRIVKKPSALTRLNVMKRKIITEDSLRSKILSILDMNYYRGVILSRSELRVVMGLKN